MFGFFSNIGPWELVIIILVALIVVGPDKLPEMARSVARTLNNLRDIGNGYKRELQDVINIDEINELRNSVQGMQRDMQNMVNPLVNPPPPAKTAEPSAPPPAKPAEQTDAPPAGSAGSAEVRPEPAPAPEEQAAPVVYNADADDVLLQ